MFTTDITLTDDQTNETVFSQISVVDSKSIRKDATQTLGEPNTLTISHQTTGANMKAKDRHLIRRDMVKEDTGTDEVDAISASAYFVIEAPRRIFAEADILAIVTELADFVKTPANLTKLLNGEP
jgi:hypothetical protein